MDWKWPVDIYQKYEPGTENKLCQGDILDKKAVNIKIEPDTSINSWIVANAICDLINTGKTDYIRFVPVRPLEFFIEQNLKANVSGNNIRKRVEDIIRGKATKTFFLPPSDGLLNNTPSYAEIGYVVSVYVGNRIDELSSVFSKLRLAH
jgi:hypothetical protein